MNEKEKQELIDFYQFIENNDLIGNLPEFVVKLYEHRKSINCLEAKLPHHKILLQKMLTRNREVVKDSLRDITHLLKDENETGVSYSHSTHGALPLVRKSECEAVATTTAIGEYEHGTLENRIGFGSLCPDCNSPYIMFTPDHYFECTSCDHTWT